MKKRIFVAIDLPSFVKQAVSDYQNALKKIFNHLRISWEKTEKLHLTLKFLGNIDEKQLENLKIIVSQIAAANSGFQLQTTTNGVFPQLQNPRVLWIGLLDKENVLTEVNQKLEFECEKIGVSRENRRYVPHLTIARIREPKKSLSLAKKHLQNKFSAMEFEVSEIVVYESNLQPDGSVYLPVARFELKKARFSDSR